MPPRPPPGALTRLGAARWLREGGRGGRTAPGAPALPRGRGRARAPLSPPAPPQRGTQARPGLLTGASVLASEPSGVDGDVHAPAHALSPGEEKGASIWARRTRRVTLWPLPVPRPPARRGGGSIGPGAPGGLSKDRGVLVSGVRLDSPEGRTQPVLGWGLWVSGWETQSRCLDPGAPGADQGSGPACAPTPGSSGPHPGCGGGVGAVCHARGPRSGRDRPGRRVLALSSASLTSARVVAGRPWTRSPAPDPSRRDPRARLPLGLSCSCGARPVRAASGAPARHRISLRL